MRKRAIQPEEKEQRRQAILDAARELWIAHPDRIASVAEVAKAAGLAKGTVYLYFPSKEELLLALFEQMVDGFFDALIARCETSDSLDLDDLLEVTRLHLVEAPGYLPLASLVLGWAERQLPVEALTAFHQCNARHLERAATALLPHFPLGAPSQAAELLNSSYALILGLWHLRRPVQLLPDLKNEPALAAVTGDYFTTLSRALVALWQGHMSGLEPTG